VGPHVMILQYVRACSLLATNRIRGSEQSAVAAYFAKVFMTFLSFLRISLARLRTCPWVLMAEDLCAPWRILSLIPGLSSRCTPQTSPIFCFQPSYAQMIQKSLRWLVSDVLTAMLQQHLNFGLLLTDFSTYNSGS
jgi:hypothetical protein